MNENPTEGTQGESIGRPGDKIELSQRTDQRYIPRTSWRICTEWQSQRRRQERDWEHWLRAQTPTVEEGTERMHTLGGT